MEMAQPDEGEIQPGVHQNGDANTVANETLDEGFTYVLEQIVSVADAVERIRKAQEPKRQRHDQHKSKKSSEDLDKDARRSSADSLNAAGAVSKSTAGIPPPMRGDLPATMEEFYHCPPFTVLLTAPRAVLFSDALSGFNSNVKREEALRAAAKEWKDSSRHNSGGSHAAQYSILHETQGGILRASAVPVGSNADFFPQWTAARNSFSVMQQRTPPASTEGQSAAAAEKAAVQAGDDRPAIQPDDLRQLQLCTFFQEQAFYRSRVPLVFRYKYSPEFAETPEELRERLKQRDHFLSRLEEQYPGVSKDSEVYKESLAAYDDPNDLRKEWLYVWEQFERDLPREALFIGDVQYRNPEAALAATLSYLEYCYDLCQQEIEARERLQVEQIDKSRSAGYHGSIAEGGSGSKKRYMGFSHLQSMVSIVSNAAKNVAVSIRPSLPDFIGDPLLSVTGTDLGLYHAWQMFPRDPRKRSEKIYEAVREVILASQQSFMGFPYQMLCEQMGTHRLASALEALEIDVDDEDDNEFSAESVEDEGVVFESALPQALPSCDTQSPTQTGLEGDQDGTAVAPRALEDRGSSSANLPRRWNDVVRKAAEKRKSLSSAFLPLDDDPSSDAKPTEQPPTSSETVKRAKKFNSVERRRRRARIERHNEKRRKQRDRLPIIVGEPRAAEFSAFISIIKGETERRRQEELKQEMSQWESTAEVHGDTGAAAFESQRRKSSSTGGAPPSLYLDDVEGSAYLLSSAALPASEETPTAPSLDEENSDSAESRGMRICVFFDEKRKVPVVVVNKLFRLFPVPGVRGLSSSEDDEEAEVEMKMQYEHHEATQSSSDKASAPAVPTAKTEKVLLLLIQMKYTLFSEEEAVVSWKWWRL